MTTYDESQPSLAATARIARHPIHPMLVPVPIVCFIGALLTDIMYAVSAEIMWADFSAWLLVVGVIVGCLAAIAGLVDLLSNRLIRAQAPAWPHAIGNVIGLRAGRENLAPLPRGRAASRWARFC